jgi:undecaprenyl-diphosphatase
MTIFQSLILGLIEGVTEFLPISSTGHLILAGEILKITDSNFSKSFEIIIQLGAICSVLVLYWKTFLNFENLKKLFVAFLPTGIIGLSLYKIVKTYLLGNEQVVLTALLLGGLALIIFEYLHKEPTETEETTDLSEISYKKSFWIGLCQSVAIIPGVSRSAATVVGGLALGLKRKTIVEFSFLLAVPTMAAASGLDLIKNAGVFSKDQFGILTVGFIVSFFVALLSIKFLLSFIKKHNFIPFGIYRIVVAIAFWLVILR